MNKKETPVNNNPVAKNAHKFNRCVAFRNKKLDYSRKAKHRNRDNDE